MFVRLAVENDADAVVDLARMNAAETRAGLTFNADKTYRSFFGYIDKASPTFFVVEEKREVFGFMVAEFYEYRAFDGLFVTQEVMFIRPDKRGTRASVLMMKHLIAWSKQLGAKEIIGGNDNGFNSERTAKFLEHFGFERVGFSMRRAV